MRKSCFRWASVFLVMIACSLIFSTPHKAHASWTANTRDDAIYNDGQGLFSADEPEKEDEPNFLTKSVSGFFRSIGDGFRWLLKSANISIDSIIFGRVGGYHGGDGIADFTFELQPGNPYGIIGATIYQMFRMISYAVIPLCVFAKLSFKSFRGMNAQQVAELKSSLYNLVVAFLLLALMPYFLDVILYLRDVVLSLIVSLANTTIFDENAGSIGLLGMFRKNADTITGSLVYIAAVGYSLYLGFLYVGYAMAFMVGFFVFPLMLIFAMFKPNLIENWISSIFYLTFIPVIDACLLLTPIFFVKLNAPSLLTLFSCMCMISARAWFAYYLGLHTAVGGNMGFMFMLAAGKLVKTTVNTVKKVAMLVGGAAAAGAGAGAAGGAEAGAAGGAEAGAAGGAEAGAAGMDGEALKASDAGITGNVNPGATESIRKNGSSASGNTSMGGIFSDSSTFGAESTGQNSGINIMDRFRLYKDKTQNSDAKSAKPIAQAVGTAVGGTLGAVIGGAATLMMGPAAASMGAEFGMSIGSGIGSGIGKLAGTSLNALSGIQGELIYKQVQPFVQRQQSNVGTTGVAVQSQAEHVESEVLSDKLPSIGGNTAVSQDSRESKRYRAQEYTSKNYTVFRDAFNGLNADYINNTRERLEPIMLKVELERQSAREVVQDSRELFRDYACREYMQRLFNDVKSHSSYTPTSAAVEAEAIGRLSQEVRDKLFNKSKGLVSDEALDEYDWFKL